MLQSISQLFKERSGVTLDEVDIRQFIERYLRREIGVRSIFCERARDDSIVVRASSALVRHEILLLEWDLAQRLQQETDFQSTRLVVRH